MSGDRVTWNDGQALTTENLNRMADIAASSEDRVWDMLFTPEYIGLGEYDKKVYPLLHEPPDILYKHGRALVYPGTLTGGVNILPAFYVVGGAGADAGDANTSVLSASGWTNPSTSKPEVYSLPDTAFPSSVTNGRTDTVYALVQREATTAARKVKDPVSGNVSTQTITTYTTATVTISTAQGPADGTFDPPTLSADSSTAWYVPLANVLLDNGSGGAWTQGTAIAQTRITQTWNPGWIKRNRVQLASTASIMSETYSSGDNGRASTPLSDRWGASISVSAVLQRKVDGVGVFVVLDDTHDWSRRFARISAGYLADSIGAAALPDGSSPAPARFDSSTNILNTFVFLGAKPTSVTRYPVAEWNVLATEDLIFYLNDVGALEVEFDGAPTSGGLSNYVIFVEASDTFLF